MKQLILFILFCSSMTWSYAQPNCLDFETETPNLNVGYTNPAGAWGTIFCNFDYKQEGSGNIYLEVSDGGGASYVYNNSDFTGDLSLSNTCQNFCYDVNYIFPGTNPGNFTNSIIIYSGGTSPLNATYAARFRLFTPLNAGAGWHTVCLPLDFCSGVGLPTNAQGYWEWFTTLSTSNVGTNCNDWNNLIQNVSGFGFYVDRGGQPSEVWGLDNFCLQDTICPNNKNFSECFHTDPVEPGLNAFSEFGYGAYQTMDGNYFIYGETTNRNLPGQNNSSDYLIMNSLDQVGVPDNPSAYFYAESLDDFRYQDHVFVEMNPGFTSQPEPHVIFSNYHVTGTTNTDIQISFSDELDCIASNIGWGNNTQFSLKVNDAMQADNGDLIILGEQKNNTPPLNKWPFIYGFDIPGATINSGLLNFIDATGSQTFDVEHRAICEFLNPSGFRRFVTTGKIKDRVLLMGFDTGLNNDATYFAYDLDSNPNSTEIGIDIAFDAANDEFIVSGIANPDFMGPIGGSKLFITRFNIFGQILWTKFYDLPGGGENVEEMHINDDGEIALTGSCEISTLFGVPRTDKSYLLKTDRDGNLIFAKKYFNAEGNEVQDLLYTIDEGYLLTGSCWTNTEGEPPIISYTQNHDVWVVKTDSNGDINLETGQCLEEMDVAISTPEPNQLTNEVFKEDVEYDVTENEEICNPFVYEVEQCTQYCPPPPGADTICDITSVIDNVLLDSCCIVELDLVNNMTNAYKIQLDIINPGSAFFDQITTKTGLMPTILSPGSIQIKRNNNGPFPIGTTDKYMSFCLSDSMNTSNLQDIKITYLDSLCQPIMDCMDTLQTECPIVPIEQDCYEIFVDDVICDSIPGLYTFCFRVKNNDVTNNLKWVDLFSTGVAFNPQPVCLSPTVPPGGTSTQVCVQLFDFSGLPLPRTITIDHAAHDSLYNYCCQDLDEIEVVLPSCCDPCEDDWLIASPSNQNTDSCCYAYDVDVTCPLTLKKVIIESITPGVSFGNVAIGGNCAPNWIIGGINPASTRAIFTPTSSTAPIGLCTDLINFCLDDTLGSPTQQVVFHYIMQNQFGQDSIACSDTLQYECSIDQECLEIVSDSVYCDANGNYFLDFCVKNISTPGFNANQLVLNVQPPNPNFLFVTPSSLTPIPLNQGSTYCGTVQIGGITPLSPLPGQTINLGFVMHENNAVGQDTCCVDEEILSVTLPPCTDCCDDFQGFCNNVQFYSSIYGICDTGFVKIIYADSCTVTDIDWGDGTTETKVGSFNTTHNYTTPGNYVVCADFKETSDGGASFCWNKLVCDTLTIEDCPMFSTPCDSIEFDTMAYLGWSAMTCYSGSDFTTEYVIGIADITDHENAAIGNNWGPPFVGTPPVSPNPPPAMYHGPASNPWNKTNLGEVFGVAVDPFGNIYTSSFSMYLSTPLPFGTAGAPAIYKLNAYDGNITVLNNTLPQAQEPSRDNQYPTFGNICYNFNDHLVYVSNLEDGKIYALDANTGVQVDVFDHGLPDNGLPGFTDHGERIFGIGYNHVENRIYYSVWNLDYGTGPQSGKYNEIWSIGLDQNGEFISPNIGNYEFDLPYILYSNYSNPAADISFDATGTKMLISERMMGTASWASNRIITFPHQARTLEYFSSSPTAPFSNTYVAEPVNKYLSTNSTGGNDYAYGDDELMHCDSFVVLMEDAINIATNGNVYGLRGLANTGGFVSTSWWLDIDMNIVNQDKTLLGDVEIFRNLCCGYTPPPITCDSLDWQGFDVVIDTSCVGNQIPDVILTPVFGSVIPDWIEYDFACDNVIDQTDVGAPYNPVNWMNLTNPNGTFCATAYKVVNGDTCDFEIFKDFSLDPCPPIDSCCQSQDIFQMAMDAMQIYSNLDSGIVENTQLNDCHQVEIDWGDGQMTGPIMGSQLPQSHQYSSNGVYLICVTVFELDASGAICFEDSRCREVDVIDVGVEDLVLLENVRLYPNPTEGQLTIDAPAEIELTQLQIFDLHGRLLRTDDLRSNQSVISLSQFADGVYFILVSDQEGRMARSKIIKQSR